jgi:hypothetical protein
MERCSSAASLRLDFSCVWILARLDFGNRFEILAMRLDSMSDNRRQMVWPCTISRRVHVRFWLTEK